MFKNFFKALGLRKVIRLVQRKGAQFLVERHWHAIENAVTKAGFARDNTNYTATQVKAAVRVGCEEMVNNVL